MLHAPTFKYKVNKVISLVFALSVIGSPSLAWSGGGEGGCPYSKDKANQDAKTEQVEETDAQLENQENEPLFFALSVIAGPSLAWGWGEGGCSYSKDKKNQETKTEQVKETDA